MFAIHAYKALYKFGLLQQYNHHLANYFTINHHLFIFFFMRSIRLQNIRIEVLKRRRTLGERIIFDFMEVSPADSNSLISGATTLLDYYIASPLVLLTRIINVIFSGHKYLVL